MASAPAASEWLPIGELARRSGVAASALRFYEAEGLIQGGRSDGGRRQYPRHVLRRVAFIRAAQAVGLGLGDVRDALAGLPDGRTPTRADWERLSRAWQPLLDERIAVLQRLRERLAGCIGCGCLSLKTCALYNPGDGAAVRGPGARYLAGDRPVGGLPVQVQTSADLAGAALAGKPDQGRARAANSQASCTLSAVKPPPPRKRSRLP